MDARAGAFGWAATQNNLGNALESPANGKRTAGSNHISSKYGNCEYFVVIVGRYFMHVIASAKPKKKRPRVLEIVFIFWLSLTCAGLVGLWLYSTAPGKDANPPDRWPKSSILRRAPGASTLVMFVHPKCPCSRASIGELAVLLAHSSGHLRAQVIFLKPPGKEDSWVRTDLWRAASELPGTVVISDLYGREADLFYAVSPARRWFTTPRAI